MRDRRMGMLACLLLVTHAVVAAPAGPPQGRGGYGRLR